MLQKSLCDGKKFDIKKENPKRDLGVLKQTKDRKLDDAKKEKIIEQRQKGLDMEYEAEMHMFIKRKYLLEENETEAFSLILNSY